MLDGLRRAVARGIQQATEGSKNERTSLTGSKNPKQQPQHGSQPVSDKTGYSLFNPPQPRRGYGGL